MFGIGPFELVIVLVVALLVLGPKKLPEMARSLGRGMAEFRRASSDLRSSLTESLEEAESPPDEASTRPDTAPAAQNGETPAESGGNG